MKISKSNKGITLIALIITIIVLLILAAITISQLNENGIIGKTKEAKEKTEKATASEIINIKVMSANTNYMAEKGSMATLQYIADRLCEDDEIEYVTTASKQTASLEKINVGDAQSIFTKLKKYKYEFEINGKMQITLKEGN